MQKTFSKIYQILVAHPRPEESSENPTNAMVGKICRLGNEPIEQKAV